MNARMLALAAAVADAPAQASVKRCMGLRGLPGVGIQSLQALTGASASAVPARSNTDR